MAKTKTTKLPVTQTKTFAVLEMAGQEYRGDGLTTVEAIENIPLDFTQIKTKGVLTITQGNKKCERLFYLRPLKALFAGKVRKIGQAKQMESLLK